MEHQRLYPPSKSSLRKTKQQEQLLEEPTQHRRSITPVESHKLAAPQPPVAYDSPGGSSVLQMVRRKKVQQTKQSISSRETTRIENVNTEEKQKVELGHNAPHQNGSEDFSKPAPNMLLRKRMVERHRRVASKQIPKDESPSPNTSLLSQQPFDEETTATTQFTTSLQNNSNLEDDELTQTGLQHVLQTNPDWDNNARYKEEEHMMRSYSSYDVSDTDSRAKSTLLGEGIEGSTGEDEQLKYDVQDDEIESHGSMSYTEKRERSEQQARQAAARKAKAGMMKTNTHDFLDASTTKTAIGVAGLATVGCVLMGPIGLLVGAAAAGIGVGVMQIPQEQRSDLQNRATEALKKAQDSALEASESLSSSCARTCNETGVTDHVPLEIRQCFSGVGDEAHVADGEGSIKSTLLTAQQDEVIRTVESKSTVSPKRTGNFVDRNKRVACMRRGDIIPVHQIYGLLPEKQPRAWLDVLASAETSDADKMEAMEEVILMAKDKYRARLLLDGGILDSVIWVVERYIEKQKPSGDDKRFAKLASQCCLVLGKAHCAAVHTEGDLMLMSLYERGTVPEERQLAQMLHEVPYHARVTNTLTPLTKVPQDEVFALRQMTLPQAEKLAASIKMLAETL